MTTLGPLGWRNWQAALGGFAGEIERSEAMLYSDAVVSGSITEGLGPYELLSAMADSNKRVRPEFVLRMRFGVPDDFADMGRTDESGYHGGDIYEEFAALVGLALGIRCRSGGRTRLWVPDGDPDGQPIEFDHRPPYLPERGRHGRVLPGLSRSVDAALAVPLLSGYADLDAQTALRLVRAARTYQQAVWVADADPSQAWIMLVSAIEVAAEAFTGRKLGPFDRLQWAWPDLAKDLEQVGGESAESIAKLVAPLVKSKVRFLRFLDQFCPLPPSQRPPEAFQVDWKSLPMHFGRIYDYRSRALHGGHPFPEPMCESPLFGTEFQSEIPLGESTRVNDSTWLKDVVPMLLATFEYVTRGALQAWWDSL